MRPLHICYICSEYPPASHGGIGTFTQTLARALVERGHKVTALGLYPEEFAGTETDHGVNVIRLSRRGVPLVKFAANRRKFAGALAELHAQTPVDIVEGGELDVFVAAPSSPGVKILRMHGGPTFFHVPSRIQVWKERWSFKVADELCAVSRCVAEGTRSMLALGSRHIEVIHNSIDVQLFSPSVTDLREEEGLIVFAGTITERKGICELIRAMPRVVAEVPTARLEVYGGEAVDPAPKTSLTAELISWMTPEVSAHVEWKGRVPRSTIAPAIQRASVCVYPSHIEAMPLAWLEGLAAGKAVVASQTGPGPEIIDDGITGLLCDPHDPDSIANALIRVLKDKELRQRLGSNARRAAQQLYAVPKITDQNEAYYRAVVARHGKRGGSNSTPAP